MHEKRAAGLRAWAFAIQASAEDVGFRMWRPFWGGQRLDRPIFMIGCPRSGTSISSQLFARHPQIADLSEAGEVWDPSHYADPEADHYWRAADVTPRESARLHDRFEFARRVRRRERFFNKHPRNSVRTEYLRVVFPDAYFIHVIRDGRPVVRSLLEMIEREPQRKAAPMGAFCKPPNWRELLRDDPVEQAALQWREIVRYVLDQRDALGDRYHEYRYEDLCADTRGVLGRAFAFAGLRTDQDVLRRLPEALPLRSQAWRQAFSTRQIDTIERVQAPLLRHLGYDL